MKVGVITIHRVYNYGSILQTYALQEVMKGMGYEVEVIDYLFPNSFHRESEYVVPSSNPQMGKEEKILRYLYGTGILKQHKNISRFLKEKISLSTTQYSTPDSLKLSPPKYDVYITGSDQVWNPRYCKGDPAFMLHFAPDSSLKVSYAASIGESSIPKRFYEIYKQYLKRYNYISVRENSSVNIIKDILRKEASVVLDPTLLLNSEQWNKTAVNGRQYKKKYVLCYFLNYTFNAFPYVDSLAHHIQQQTGYDLLYVGRPPHEFRRICRHCHYMVGCSPEKFLALVRDAEMILTTSFHGTAFAINYGKPLFSIVQSEDNKIGKGDERQTSLLNFLGLESRILSLEDTFPSIEDLACDYTVASNRLEQLRRQSIMFLHDALKTEHRDTYRE